MTSKTAYRIKLAQPLIDDDEKRAVIEALASGQLAQGPRVEGFERDFARYIGVRHAVAVNSGTAALHLALLAHGIGPGDEVVVPAFSFAATANVVLQAGARPVFADVRDDDFGIDIDQAAAAIGQGASSGARALIAVHLYGQPCDIEPLQALCARRGVALIEDAAQAVGASLRGRHAGSSGTGAFSFYATKNLTTGEGGMLTTDDNAVADRARMLRSQGERERYVTEELGWNYRMTEPAAALGRVQLEKLDARNALRRRNAARLSAALAPAVERGIVLPQALPSREHAWHQYTVRVLGGRDVRDTLQARLRERGIETAVFYPLPIHRQPLYRRLGYGDLELPVAQRLADTVLSLPVHPALSDDDVDTVATAVLEALA